MTTDDDALVYLDPDGTHYVGRVGEQWYRWPAERDGWQARMTCGPTEYERCRELDARLSVLALRLSGVFR